MTMASTDPLGAFCPDDQIQIAGAAQGPLSGLSFAVKDMFDIKGARTGNGHPGWRAAHPPAPRHATAVARLLAAGADLVGRTISDELAYSLTGENFHYGTPLNPAAPDRVPGGSSSGSASVVAGGVVPFALGSDCGGSVRVPASYCGILGMRPSHGRIPLDGAVPFAPSFDCAGWFARDPDIFRKVGHVLLADDQPRAPIHRLGLAQDGFALLEAPLRDALLPVAQDIAAALGPADEVTLAPDGLDIWSEAFRTLQAAEVWHSVGDWVQRTAPRFGPGVAERLETARTTPATAVAAAAQIRQAARNRLDALLPPGSAILLPSVPRVAPLRGLPAAEVEVTFRHQAMNLLCCAGLAGLPQISLPLVRIDGLPLGLSLLGGRGSDVALLDLAVAICADRGIAD
ncbi:MAG: amidase [Qingshengfaniella sp.]